MEDKIYNILKNYVDKYYVPLDDHMIRLLAKELDAQFHNLYWRQELEYLKEDVGMYAEDHGYFDLTDQQIYNVADKIRNSEWYCSIDPEDMEYYIKQELKKGEQ